MYGPLDGTTISSTSIDGMAEKHNGMFGKVVKENQLGNCILNQ